jgi:hypothetical protein
LPLNGRSSADLALLATNGAVVSSVMRSGTNEFHGSAFEFLRDTDLNAIGYIFGQRRQDDGLPALQPAQGHHVFRTRSRRSSALSSSTS